MGKTCLVDCAVERDVSEREEICPAPRRQDGHRFRSARPHSTIKGQLALRVRRRFQTSYMPTIAPVFKLAADKSGREFAKLWDVSGDARFAQLAFTFTEFRHIDVYILVFDVTRSEVRRRSRSFRGLG